MREFNNLQEIRDYIASIPEENFLRGWIGTGNKRGCVIGQLNLALHGNTGYSSTDWELETPRSVQMLRNFGVNPSLLAQANNESPTTPKQGALKYLDKILNHE